MSRHIKNAFVIALGLVVPVGVQAATLSDQVAASFARDLNRTPVTTGPRVQEAPDPAQYLINDAVRSANRTLVASFERDLNRAPTVTGPHIRGGTDPVQYLVNNALRQVPTRAVANVRYEPRS